MLDNLNRSSKLFITHASADVDLVRALVVMLRNVGVPNDRIFCTSLPGHGVPGGIEFKEFIRQALVDSDAVLALLTPSYFASQFSICELGATWAMQKHTFFPFLVPPIGFKDLKSVLQGVNGLMITSESDLSELKDRVSSLFAPGGCSTPQWDGIRENFLSELSRILPLMKDESPVSRDRYDKALRDLDEYKAEYARKLEELKRTKDELDRVGQLKDKTERLAISDSYLGEKEKFEAQLERARQALSPFTRLTKEAFFHAYREDSFVPEYAEWGDHIQKEIQRGFLVETGASLAPNPRSADVRKANDELAELAKLIKKATPEFEDMYEEEHGHVLDLDLRPFWHEWFGISE